MNISLFQEQQTPFYYYDLSLLRLTLEAINQAISSTPHFHVHYAVKACANPSILKTIAQSGLGADCVSGGEIETAVTNGFMPERIVFAGVGKTDQEIQKALEKGIACFNVESIPELENINLIAQAMDKVAHISFRINPNVDAHTHAKITTGLNENKFGIAIEDMIPAIRRAQQMKHVKYIGLHFHIGSQITTMQPFEELADCINILQQRLDAAGIISTSINVGGGLGIDYHQVDKHPIPDFQTYFQVFQQRLQLRPRQEVHFELGRSIVAQCGTLISRVLYVKEGHQKKFLILDAGMTDLMRPAMYGSYHQAVNLTSTHSKQEKYDIVGPICESSDVFHTNYSLPLTQRGDLIAFRSAGAYGEIMASQYNCRPLPKSMTSDDFLIL